MSAEYALEKIQKILDWELPDATTVTRIMEIMIEYDECPIEEGFISLEEFYDNEEGDQCG